MRAVLLSLLAAAGLAQSDRERDRSSAEGQELAPWTPVARPRAAAPTPPPPTAAAVALKPMSVAKAEMDRITERRAGWTESLNLRREQLLRDVGRYVSASSPLADVPTILLAADRLAGKEVVTAGQLYAMEFGGSRPNFLLGDCGAGPNLPVSLAKLPKGVLKEVLKLDGIGGWVVLVRGRVALTDKRRPYLEASVVESVGDMVQNPTISRFLQKPFKEELDVASAKDLLRRNAAALARQGGRTYVRIQALVADPAAYTGRPISTIGVSNDMKLADGRLVLSFGDSYANQNRLDVLAAGLPLETKVELLRHFSPTPVIAVQGVVRRTAQGAFYLEAAGAQVLRKVYDLFEVVVD
ncbi:MAG: hypothetical protein HYZ75_06710 [Elusimicrobia bacterium]|nr:hypothetical protein [Elusimicrobiota bacterium]